LQIGEVCPQGIGIACEALDMVDVLCRNHPAIIDEAVLTQISISLECLLPQFVPRAIVAA